MRSLPRAAVVLTMRTPFLHLLIAIAFVLLCGQRCTSIRLTADHIGVAHGGLLEWNEAQGDASVRGDDSTTSFRLGVSISPFMFAFILDQLSPYGMGFHPGLLVLAGMFPLGKGGTLCVQAGAGLTDIGPRGRIADQSPSCQVVYLWRGIDARTDALFAGLGYFGPYPQSYEIWWTSHDLGNHWFNPVPLMSLKTFIDRLYVTGGYSAILWRWLELDISIRVPISSPLLFHSDYPAPHSWKDKYFTTGFEFRIIPDSF